MDFSDRRGLKNAARNALAQASYNPKKLILIHTGAILLLSLVSNIASIALQQQIDGTGGLSGLGLRSVLSTIQQMLSVVQSLAIPFWDMGLILAMLNIARGQQAAPNTLLGGFRRFGPVLRLTLLRGSLIMGSMLAGMYLGIAAYAATPLSASLANTIAALSAPDGTVDMMLVMDSLGPMELIPMLLTMLAVMAVTTLPVIYRYRMADYFLMDHPKAGAMVCLHMSTRMLYRKRLELLKLDLHFWWYYALQALAAAALLLDVLLMVTGITVPIDATVLQFLSFALYALCVLAIHWFARDRVEVTYATAYEALLKDLPPMPGANTAPKEE